MSAPQSPAIEMYQKDIEELEKLINIAIRPNIKRQLIEYKNNLTNLMNEEKKKLEAEQKKKEEESKSTTTESSKEKEKDSGEIDPAKLSKSLLFINLLIHQILNLNLLKLHLIYV